MGEPAIPSNESRAKLRELAKEIVDSVRSDDTMPYHDATRDVVEDMLFRLSQEIELLQQDTEASLRAEIDELRAQCKKWQDVFTGLPHDAQEIVRELYARRRESV